MSVQVISAVWESHLTGSSNRFVLVALADRADPDGYCWPHIADVIKKTALSRATVKRSIRAMETMGVLHRTERQTVLGDPDSNMYRIDLPALARLAAPVEGVGSP